MNILDKLNEEQQQALLCTQGAVLVTAGAGTGKTRLLTHRIAYLIEELKVNPYNILAITFTNKAANEMKTRVEALVDGGNRVWISTFHSMCVRILRADIDKLGSAYDRNFTIYSDSDSEKVVKTILKEYSLGDDHKKFMFHISNCKNKNMEILQYKKQNEYMREIDDVVRVYNEYERRLQESNALDFDDLLTKTFKLFVNNPEVLEFYSRRFEYILVDEFQDTNKIQYDLTRMLASCHQNIFVVGDEDQSIYSWRGADFTNIFNITKDYSNAKIFKLQQNYRCTKEILNTANTLIALNSERFNKKLWTNKENSEKVSYNVYYDEQEEAENVSAYIHSLVKRGGYDYSDIAILVRLNALTMPFEEKLLSYNIPYKIYGGFKFFERAEIKNLLSYLRIFVNPKDETALTRIINFPKRGVGDGALATLKEIAWQEGKSVLEVVLNLEDYPQGKKLIGKLACFAETYKQLAKDFESLSLDDFVVEVINRFKIRDAFASDSDEDVDKLMNLDQFVASVKLFVENNPGQTLIEYLESVTLQSDIDSMDESDNVTVATVHAVKGLEFKVVFVVGMEDGVFPLSRCKDNQKDLEEERRLAYVAFTRAGEKLYVSSCKTRFLYGRRNYEMESKFISESGLGKPKPKKIFEFDDYSQDYSYGNKYKNNASFGAKTANNIEKTTNYSSFGSYNTKQDNFSSFMPKPKTQVYVDTNSKASGETAKYKVGQVVGHTKFGVGTIVAISDGGKMADINFGAIGTKTLMLDIAPLKIIKD